MARKILSGLEEPKKDGWLQRFKKYMSDSIRNGTKKGLTISAVIIAVVLLYENRKDIAKVTINLDQITLKIRAKNFNKLVKKHLNLSIIEHDEEFEIITPYKTGKAQRGAIVIEAKNQSDIFNLPSANLKRFIQGIIWRDEHFSGDTLTEIAQREGYSDAYVGKCIMTSFDILMSA